MCFVSLFIYCINYIKKFFICDNNSNTNINSENLNDIGVSWNNIHQEHIITTVINPMNNHINNPYLYEH
jgi:hypothetical protein